MRVWPAFLIWLVLFGAVGLVASHASADVEPRGISRMHASGWVTNMGYTSGLPGGVHYAAGHRGDHQATFKPGSTLRLEHGRRHLIVRLLDWCAGESCRMLDLSSAGFSQLFGSTTQGVGRVVVYCGRGGKKPMRICVMGEDQ